MRTTSIRPSLLQGDCQQLQHELAWARGKVTELEGVVASKEQLLSQLQAQASEAKPRVTASYAVPIQARTERYAVSPMPSTTAEAYPVLTESHSGLAIGEHGSSPLYTSASVSFLLPVTPTRVWSGPPRLISYFPTGVSPGVPPLASMESSTCTTTLHHHSSGVSTPSRRPLPTAFTSHPYTPVQPSYTPVCVPVSSTPPLFSTVQRSAENTQKGAVTTTTTQATTSLASVPTMSAATTAQPGAVTVTEVGEPVVSSAAPAQTVSASLPLLSAAMLPTSLLSQLPQIPKFTGEDQPDGETFQDWLEQFESVAELGKWGGHCKLVNSTTRLKGTAYSFYRSCSTEQRSNYPLLVAELKKRFTPVRLPAIQSQVFHEQK